VPIPTGVFLGDEDYFEIKSSSSYEEDFLL
jgi:hypothetical protein